MKTRVAIAEAIGRELTLAEADLAEPATGEVCVRMEACGVCRSDLHAIDGGEDVRFPAVLGHEGAGVVESVGPGVGTLAPGQRVVLSWTPACGACPACRRGEVHLCVGVAMSAAGAGPLTLGGQPLDRFMALGLWSDRVVVPAAMAVPVAGDAPPEEACLLGCAVTTGFGAATNAAAVRWGESVLVLGCGGVGLAAVQGARIAGAARIVAVDPLAERREAALHVGATEAIAPEEAGATVRASTDGGVDAAIECVGSTATILEAFRLVRPGGRAVVVGLPELSATVEVPALMLLTERTLTGSIYGSSNPAIDFPKLIDLRDRGRLDLAALVGRTRPFAEVNDAIEDTRQGRHTRVVLTF
ncbi:MAG: zinc-binding dehydrogenase [Thermoanaerobaculia bacterium]|nr:zinc-binding dehydrogenase [Thermoanaerobaculia bacterium]